MNKIVSWNVNGLRACIKNGFFDMVNRIKPDIICLQEIKLQNNQIPVEIDDLKKYQKIWNFGLIKGYSGTAIFTKLNFINYKIGIGDVQIDNEGRVITVEFDDFYLINAYVPNAQPELKRIDFRLHYEEILNKYLNKLNKIKPVIYCGDLNVAHNEIDLKNPNTNHGNPGFSDEERNMMTKLLSKNFVDVFRKLYPNEQKYTWWSYRMDARKKNIGWRIDYFIVSDIFLDRIKNIIICDEIYGSDHCPIQLNIY